MHVIGTVKCSFVAPCMTSSRILSAAAFLAGRTESSRETAKRDFRACFTTSFAAILYWKIRTGCNERCRHR